MRPVGRNNVMDMVIEGPKKKQLTAININSFVFWSVYSTEWPII